MWCASLRANRARSALVEVNSAFRLRGPGRGSPWPDELLNSANTEYEMILSRRGDSGVAMRSATAAVATLLLAAAHSAASDVLWSSSGGSAWLTGSNWTGGNVPTATDNAQFGANPTGTNGVGINFANTTNAGTQVNGQRVEEVGAIELTLARTSSHLIGNSSGTAGATGTLRLMGATVNSITHTVLRNNSSQNFTLQNTQGSGNQTMAVELGDATNNVVAMDGSGNITISSNVFGSSKKLRVQGAGSGDLILSGSNTFTGGIELAGSGKLRLGAASALPTTGNISLSESGRLRFATAGTYGANTQTLTLNPNQTANAAIDLQTSNIAVTLATNIALDADSRIESNGGSGALMLSGNLSGSGTLVKQAGGNLILSGTGNTATGGTQIGNGAVTVNSGSKLGTGPLTMFQTSTNNTALNLNNTAQTIGNLTSQFTAVTGPQTQVITLNGTALTVNQTTDGTYGTGAVATLTSTITGSGSVTKAGGAALTLTGANTYTGTTTVSAGKLVVNGTHTGGDNYTVASGGSIGGSGVVTLASSKSFTLNGTVSPGNSTGNLTLSGTSNSSTTVFAPGGSYTWEINADSTHGGTQGGATGWDVLTIDTVSVTAGGSNSKFTVAVTGLNISATNWSPASGQKTFTIVDHNGAGAGFSASDIAKFDLIVSGFDPDENLGGFYLRATGGSDLELVYVPEPTAASFVAAAGILFTRRRVRRRIPHGR